MKAEKDVTLGVNKEILKYHFAMERYLEAKDEYEETQYNLRDFFEYFDSVNLEDESYEFIRDFYGNMERFCNNKELKEQVKAIRDAKKIEKYPQLLKPTFYPEIDKLDLSLEDKMRIDKVLRKNHGYFVSKTTFKRMGFNSFDELELLKSIGVVEKFYEIRCSDCCERMDLMPEEKLNLHKRVWELRKNSTNNLKDEEIEELDDLLDKGYLELYSYCDNCDSDLCIDNNESFESEVSGMSVIYKISKMPDLWSEQI